MSAESLPKRIVSTRADEPELEERLDAFVVDLGRLVDELQDLEASGGLAELEARARVFGEESRELGYAPLALCAAGVVSACRSRDPEGARKQLQELTDVSQRVRSGHRGAA